MTNHKRKRHPNRRAGCKMCKPQKSVSGYKGLANKEILGKGGFGKIRALRHAEKDLNDRGNYSDD